VCVDGLFCDSQAQPKSALTIVEPYKRGECFLDLPGRKTAAAVFDFDHDTPICELPAQLHLAARSRVLDGVTEQVADGGPNQAVVDADPFVLLDHEAKLDAFRFSLGYGALLDVLEEHAQRRPLPTKLDARSDPRDLQRLLDELARAFETSLEGADRAALRRELSLGLEELKRHRGGGEGIAQLVRDESEVLVALPQQLGVALYR
jgi:hypothetical protein